MGPGVLANHQPMDVEPSFRIGTACTSYHDARDGPGLFAGAEADLSLPPMMTLLLMERLLPFPQAPLLPLPKPLPLIPHLRLPRLKQLDLPRRRRTHWIGWRPTGHRNSRSPPLRMDFLVPHLRRNPMGRCAAQQAIRCTCKNAGRSATARCACYMPPALAIVALVHCSNSVKNPVPPPSRAGPAATSDRAPL